MTESERPESAAGGPVVLVVEDDETALDLRTRQLSNVGCRAIGVTNSDDAIREVWNLPLLGLVLTDINLEPGTDDQSGVALARYLHRFRPELPVAGYSAIFGEERMSREDLDLFVRYYDAGNLSPEDIRAAAAELKEIAEGFELQRRAFVDERLEELRERHKIDPADFDAFRQLVPDHDLAVEQVLADAHLEARIIGRGERLPNEAEGSPTVRLRVPIVVWIRTDDEGSEVEFHGVPELYGYGATPEDAIRNALELALLYWADLRDAADVAGPLARLRRFLSGVLTTDE
jgi:CheY-like chemotaxis protein